jgi:hypothetical protein
MWIWPLYSMKPSFLNLFMKKLTCGRETLIVMDRFSDFLGDGAVRGIHLPLIRGRACSVWALTAAKFGMTPNMRLVCLPSESSLLFSTGVGASA